MKSQDLNRKEYISPLIEQVKFDNEISLVLESSPPAGPDEGYLKVPEHFNRNPFRSISNDV